jgi:predicted NodU family carbamoyl transferase
MNSVANGKIYRNASICCIYAQSTAGDAGITIVAATALWRRFWDGKRVGG